MMEKQCLRDRLAQATSPWLGFLGKILFGVSIALNVHAAPQFFTVTSTTDETDANIGDGLCMSASGACTLRAAVQEGNATPSEWTYIYLKAGTYTLTLAGSSEDNAATGDLDILGNTYILGCCTAPDADADDRIIDGNGLDRVFHIKNPNNISNMKAYFQHVTIQNGAVQFGNGGGIYNQDSTTEVKVIESIITGNNITLLDKSGYFGGGGIANNGVLYVENSTISNNTVTDGAGNPMGTGGGIYNLGIPGIAAVNAQTRLLSSVVNGNSAALGGGIRNQAGLVAVDVSIIEDNEAMKWSGGGIANISGTLLITRSEVRQNRTLMVGGGIANFDIADISQSVIESNSAEDYSGSPEASGTGGGIYNGALGVLDLVNSTVAFNIASREGGGIVNRRTMGITNTSFFDNTSVETNGHHIFNCAIKDETAGQDCSIENKDLEVTLINNLFAHTTYADNYCGGDLGKIFSKGNNLQTESTGINTCNLVDASDLLNHTPALVLDVGGGLTDNGGFTLPGNVRLPSIALVSGSPAENAANQVNCPVIDQRGYKRDALCDIGSYEYGASKAVSILVDLKVDVQSALGPSNQSVFYSITVTNKGPNVATGVRLRGDLPPSVTIASTASIATPAGSSCLLTSTGFNCSLPAMNPLSTLTITVQASAAASGTVVFQAAVSAFEPELFGPDNIATNQTTVTGTDATLNNDNTLFRSSGGGAAEPLFLLVIMLIGALRARYTTI